MTYTVRMETRVRRTLDRLPGDVYGRILRKLDALEENPRPLGVEKLAGPGDLYRVRVGHWRVVYAIRDRELVVIVIRIGHRRFSTGISGSFSVSASRRTSEPLPGRGIGTAPPPPGRCCAATAGRVGLAMPAWSFAASASAGSGAGSSASRIWR